MRKINGAMPQRKLSKGAKTMDPKQITDPVIASAFADYEAELDELEALYARQAEQLRSAKSQAELIPAPSIPEVIPEQAPNPPPLNVISPDSAAQRITAVITLASQDGVQFFAKFPKAQ